MPKIAIVHDWLVTYCGAEKVLEQVLALFPEADLFSLVDFLPAEQRAFLGTRKVNTSFLQKMPLARARYRHYLPLMPLAIEQFDLRPYDLVISCSHAVAKGVSPVPHQLHVCICFTPIRYAWDQQPLYLRQTGLDRGPGGWAARAILHKIRTWDYRTAGSVDHFIAISQFVAARIKKYYRRSSKVIYPPVDTNLFKPAGDKKDDFYLTVSRLVPYKRVDIIVEAFSHLPQHRLIVVGDGPEARRLKAGAAGNISFVGYQPPQKLNIFLQKARAFIFAAEEDFGIAPLEAQACGTPVIAYGGGACLETIRGQDHISPSGLFFNEQNSVSLLKAIAQFEEMESRITPAACRENALRFSPDIFNRKMRDFFKLGTRKP